jgi:hypothetical protein
MDDVRHELSKLGYLFFDQRVAGPVAVGLGSSVKTAVGDDWVSVLVIDCAGITRGTYHNLSIVVILEIVRVVYEYIGDTVEDGRK